MVSCQADHIRRSARSVGTRGKHHLRSFPQLQFFPAEPFQKQHCGPQLHRHERRIHGNAYGQRHGSLFAGAISQPHTQPGETTPVCRRREKRRSFGAFLSA